MIKLPKSIDLKDSTDGCMNLISRLNSQLDGLKYVVNTDVKELTNEEKVHIELNADIIAKHLVCVENQLRDIVKLNLNIK